MATEIQALVESSRSLLLSFFDLLPDSKAGRLWALLSLGQYGVGAKALVEDFRFLGALHLLVLSGSQVGCLKQALEKIYCLILYFAPLPTPFKKLAVHFLLVISLLFYGELCSWPAPLCRAILFYLLLLLLPSLNLFWQLLLTALLQCLIFSNQVLENSFYLSWGAFLLLLFLAKLGWSSLLEILVLSAVCQFFLQFLLGLEALEPGHWLLILCANAVLILLFNRLIMPVFAVLLASSFLLLLIPHGAGLRLLELIFLAPASASAQLILVAVEGILYTLGHGA